MTAAIALRHVEPAEPTFGEVLDAIEAPAALLDGSLRIAEINEAARDFIADTGAPGLRFVPGRAWDDLCRLADAEGNTVSELETLLTGIAEGRAASAAIDYVARRRGRFKTYRLTAKALPAFRGCIAVVQTDITRAGITEQRLDAAEQRLADIADLSSDWLWSTDDELCFVEMAAPRDPFWRRVQPKLIGSGVEDLLGDAGSEIARRRPFADAVATVEVDGAKHRLCFGGKPLFAADGSFRGYVGLASDVTRIFEAERGRDLAEARLREIAELSSDWFWETDSEHRFTYMSDTRRASERMGPDKTIGRRRIDLLDRTMTDADALSRHIDDLENHRPFHDFVYGASNLGKPRYLKISGKPRFDDEGRFIGYVGTATEVTDLVAEEKRREAAERRLKAAVENMPGGIGIWDKDDRLVVCNDEYWKVGGIDGPAMIGASFEELARLSRSSGAVVEDGATLEAKIQERMKLHRSAVSALELTLSDGSVRQVRERRLDDGSTVSITMDITGLKRRERTLAEQRSLLQTTLDHISDGILVVDKSWRVVAVNDTFASLLGMPGEIARVGTHLAAVIEWLAKRGDYGAEQATISAVRVIDEMHARSRWYDERLMPDGRQISWRVREMHGGGRVIAIADVSEQRQAEQRREQLRATMTQAQQLEAISRLAGGLAHDLNNMLMPVMTLTELAMEELPEGSPARGDLERVIGAAEHARGLVRQLLTFSRSNAPRPGNATALDPVARAASDLVKATSGPDLGFVLNFAAEDIDIPLGQTEIQQIVVNLGLNAAQAIGDRKGTLTIETALVEEDDDLLRANPSLDSARRYARLTVADDGPGIPTDVLPRIFDPFFTTKPVGQGTGLGLAVVHGLVNQVGGAIEVNGERGARFDILLPVIERGSNWNMKEHLHG